MQASKIRLSPAEAALISDAQVILTKNSIIQKTIALLSDVQEDLQQQANSFNLSNSPSPKISKGENYLGLPYVILDFPRISKGEDLFFIRSMFWWGNFFSSTLQISGIYKTRFHKQLCDAYPLLVEKRYFIGVNPDPWLHHFGEDNYKPISHFSQEAFAFVLEESQHIKIAARWPIQEWDSAANHLSKSWSFLTKLCT
ncbi:MAG: hypothetical protein EOO10_10680 [Chitinophagaceae bacterium]|nr:MAG: hypothetical protein EOO10_10680 [Chitinophagaceae bacterium]